MQDAPLPLVVRSGLRQFKKEGLKVILHTSLVTTGALAEDNVLWMIEASAQTSHSKRMERCSNDACTTCAQKRSNVFYEDESIPST